MMDYFGDRGNGHGKVYGVTVGIVTNNKDPEKLGRVKLKLTLRECGTETDWVRIATPMAGKDKGVFFLPEVEDEVLVAFNEGDIRQPYVIGMLWNATETPPEKNEDGKNNIRKIKSRSGHEIILDDTDSKGKIVIRTKEGLEMLMEDAESKIRIKDSGGKNLIQIDGKNNAVSIQADMKISLKAKGCSIEIDGAKGSINVTGGNQLKIKAPSVEIEADATLNIKSGGMLNIKGSMVKIN